MNKFGVIGLAVLVVLAGCSGPFESGEQPGSGSTVGETTIVTPTTAGPSTSTGSETPATGSTFSDTAATENILIRTSELPSGYVLDGETLTTRETADTATAETFSERGVLRLHERAYLYNNGSGENTPQLVLASTTVFESDVQAQNYQESLTDSLRENGSIETIEYEDGISAQQIQFTNEEGLRTVVTVARVDNLVLYIASSDPDRHYLDSNRELFITMYAEAVRYAEE